MLVHWLEDIAVANNELIKLQSQRHEITIEHRSSNMLSIVPFAFFALLNEK